MPVYLTSEGIKNFKIELKELKENQRPACAKRMSFARELGDLKENADYHAAKEQLGRIDSRINHLERIILEAQPIESMQVADNTKIYIGASAEIYNIDKDIKHTYQFLSEYEADVEKGKLNIKSPIGRSMLGKGEGESVEVRTPGGLQKFKILKVWR